MTVERLTKKVDNHVYFATKAPHNNCPTTFCIHAKNCGQLYGDLARRTCPVLKAADRLAAYEDTGLMPENWKRLAESHIVAVGKERVVIDKDYCVVSKKAFDMCISECDRLRSELCAYHALGTPEEFAKLKSLYNERESEGE